jgi:probable HAF family extracellular repeat protein
VTGGDLDKSHATLWVNGVPTDVGVLPGFDGSIATDVNDAGQVVGHTWSYSETCDRSAVHGFVWENS